MSRRSVSPWVAWGLYVFAAILVLSPVSDLATTVWPARFDDLGWRYGFLGLLGGYLQTPLLGLLLAMGTAYWQGHARALRASGLLGLVGAVVLILAMVTFGLDVLAMRQMRPEDQRAGVLVGGALQELKYLGATLVLVFLGVGGEGTARRLLEREAAEPLAPGIIKRD